MKPTKCYAHLNFSVEQLNCFLRPVSIVCDELQSLSGQALLFLTSLYRCYEIQGYFSDQPERGFFPFATAVLGPALGLTFSLRRSLDPLNFSSLIIDDLSVGGPVVVPGNLRGLPGCDYFDRKDWPHYFILDEFRMETDCFIARYEPSPTTPQAYRDFRSYMLPRRVLAETSRLYWESFCGQHSRRPFSDESCLWALRIAKTGPLKSNQELLRRLLVGIKRCRARESECRALAEFRKIFESEAPDDQVYEELQRYLAIVNFNAVHLHILLRILEEIDKMRQQTLALILQTGAATASQSRTQFFVQCMAARPSQAVPDWLGFEEGLCRQYEDERRAIVLVLVEILRCATAC